MAGVSRPKYVLVAIAAGDDQVDANRMMREIAETLAAKLPPKTPTWMTTVDHLPKPLARR